MGGQQSMADDVQHDMSHASYSMSSASDDLFSCCDGRRIERKVTHPALGVKGRALSRSLGREAGNSVAGTGPKATLIPRPDVEDNQWMRIPTGTRMACPKAIQDHPYLSQYFLKLLDAPHVTVAKNSGVQWSDGANNHTKIILRQLASQAFGNFDNNGNGVLEKSESKVFFQHYVQCLLLFVKANVKKELKDQIDAKKLDAHVEQQHVRFGLEDNRFRQAFAVVDSSGDGMLQKGEVVDALTPGHPTYERFHDALGLQINKIKIRKKQAVKNREKPRRTPSQNRGDTIAMWEMDDELRRARENRDLHSAIRRSESDRHSIYGAEEGWTDLVSELGDYTNDLMAYCS